MKKTLFCCLLSLLMISGCSTDERPQNSEEESAVTSLTTSIATQQTTLTSATTESTTTITSTTVSEITTTTTVTENITEPDDVIPPAIQTPRVEGNRLLFTISDVYSDGEYYDVDISGVKLDSTADVELDTTYIKGDLYGDFRLDLNKDGAIADTLKINVPRDDRFLILESVVDGLSYGCELISNFRSYSAEEYPDLIQLDFHIIKEPETPQYARFFSIIDGKITEVPVYEGGEEVAPYGTHLEMEKAGLMTQHIVASQYDGSYTVIKYEYVFDINGKKLDREKVRFYG